MNINYTPAFSSLSPGPSMTTASPTFGGSGKKYVGRLALASGLLLTPVLTSSNAMPSRSAEELQHEREDLPAMTALTDQLNKLSAQNIIITHKSASDSVDSVNFRDRNGLRYHYEHEHNTDNTGAPTEFQTISIKKGNEKPVKLECLTSGNGGKHVFSSVLGDRSWYENLSKGEKGKIPIVNVGCGALNRLENVLKTAQNHQ